MGESQRGRFPNAAFVWMPSAEDWSARGRGNATVSHYFPRKLRAGLARPFALHPLKFLPKRPTVVMHVRRGDLPRNSFRITPNEYYYRLADLIRLHLPSADVHVWAALKNPVDLHRDIWKAADFDGFKERGMNVHLDSGVDDHNNVLEAWAHMAPARH